MVRVWLRPALTALSRQSVANAKRFALASGNQSKLAVQQLGSEQCVGSIRLFSSKKDKNPEKKTLHDKFEEIDDDPTDLPVEVQYLSKEPLSDDDEDAELDPELLQALKDAKLVDFSGEDITNEEELERLQALLEGDFDEDEDEDAAFDDEDAAFDDEDDDEDGDGELSDAEWAAKYERELANADADVEGIREVEDDRLYIEMPGYDNSLGMASEGDLGDSEEEGGVDPFAEWQQGMAYDPNHLNWMLSKNKRQPFAKNKEKPWKYFVRANHPDVVELALDVDLLRLFISPTGRIRPRRFSGLTAKQQRMLARAVKISRQMALLPYLSRYPAPSPEQWRAMEDAEIARLTELAENDDGSMDDDDDDEFEELDEE